ncbi:hypothetical protein [Filimonas effusa]|uniref:Uncharacterized protein n=1 Tax=Filimonas effusa TaxID=2508721 RepID=A0A4Q1DCA2_9BACT|nr:hypothetical protein [Filimonas effusa]RXK86233.1 hypothetical protein ESB13_05345 [Filimonas effusa]
MKYLPRLIWVCLFATLGINTVHSQGGSRIVRSQASMMEDSLKVIGQTMAYDQSPIKRFAADSLFIRVLVRALKLQGSFQYPFDSVSMISKLYPADSSFRIFTWQFERESFYRQRGAIQMKTADGSLKLFPLIDVSEFTSTPTDSVRSNLNWIGAIYYKLIEKRYNNKTYYTLLGLDDNEFSTTKKWIDVLTFNSNGQPQFGGPYFAYKNDSIKPAQPAFRFCLEYKKDTRARLNYDQDMDMILFDHLVSESSNQSKKYTLIPDGDSEGFKWQNGRWEHIVKVFNSSLEDGQAPVPLPIKGDGGASDEKKLWEQSLRNMEKEKAKAQEQQPSSQKKKLQQNQRADPREAPSN